MTEEHKASAEEITRARAKYGSTEIEIDADADVSVGEDGTWVSAWVFLAKASLP